MLEIESNVERFSQNFQISSLFSSNVRCWVSSRTQRQHKNEYTFTRFRYPRTYNVQRVRNAIKKVSFLFFHNFMSSVERYSDSHLLHTGINEVQKTENLALSIEKLAEQRKISFYLFNFSSLSVFQFANVHFFEWDFFCSRTAISFMFIKLCRIQDIVGRLKCSIKY